LDRFQKNRKIKKSIFQEQKELILDAFYTARGTHKIFVVSLSFKKNSPGTPTSGIP